VLVRRLIAKPAVSDLFGLAGRRWLREIELPVEERATPRRTPSSTHSCRTGSAVSRLRWSRAPPSATGRAPTRACAEPRSAAERATDVALLVAMTGDPRRLEAVRKRYAALARPARRRRARQGGRDPRPPGRRRPPVRGPARPRPTDRPPSSGRHGPPRSAGRRLRPPSSKRMASGSPPRSPDGPRRRRTHSDNPGAARCCWPAHGGAASLGGRQMLAMLPRV
jgi:hypothetical protein